MGTNKWRTVRYTDDGCSIYECLSCYKQWESRSCVGYYFQGEYHPQQYFCSYCGTKWSGPVRSNEDNERMLGERRNKAELAKYSKSAKQSQRCWVFYKQYISASGHLNKFPIATLDLKYNAVLAIKTKELLQKDFDKQYEEGYTGKYTITIELSERPEGCRCLNHVPGRILSDNSR